MSRRIRKERDQSARSAVRILLIDDEATDRDRVRAIATSDVAPVEIREIFDHVSFFRAMQNPDFDMVITEQDLHWSSGKEILTAVKSLRPTIPVIMVVATENEEIEAACLREGLDAYISKSGELAIRLRSSIRSALQRLEVEGRVASLEDRLQQLLDRLDVGVFRTTFSGQVLDANPAFLRLIGVESLQQARATRLEELFVDRDAVDELLGRLEADNQVHDFQVELQRADGTSVWISLSESVHSAGDERVIEGIAEDVSDARRAQEVMRRTGADYRAIFEITRAPIAIVERDGTIAIINSAFEEMAGLPREEIEHRKRWNDFLPAPDADRFGDQRRQLLRDRESAPQTLRLDFFNSAGKTLHLLATEARLPGAGRTVISLLNLTERQQVEEQLLHNAFHDGLTGLPNRLSLLDRMETLLSRGARSGGNRFALLLFNLDRFKVVNDCLGHRVGDLLLQAVTRRVEGAVEQADTLARCGGDTFGVLLHPVAGNDEATAAAAGVSRVLSETFQFGEHTVYCSASFGFVLSDESRDGNELLRDAEAAMYEAKRAGRDRWMEFEPSMYERARKAFTVENELRQALSSDELQLRYQPIASLTDGTIIGFEALLRWQRAGGLLLEPQSFLDVAEDSGLIVPIGRVALKLALEQLAEWRVHDTADVPLHVSVNLSARQLKQPDLVADVRNAIAACGVPSSLLVLEITEAALVENAVAARETLDRLRALGVGLRIDSFGCGNSALSVLHRFPFDSVKVDRSFLTDIADDESRWRVVDGVHALAQHLGLQVIAEGIEETSQLRRLLAIGCRYGQGRLLSPPVDGEAAMRLRRTQLMW